MDFRTYLYTKCLQDLRYVGGMNRKKMNFSEAKKANYINSICSSEAKIDVQFLHSTIAKVPSRKTAVVLSLLSFDSAQLFPGIQGGRRIPGLNGRTFRCFHFEKLVKPRKNFVVFTTNSPWDECAWKAKAYGPRND